MSDKIELNKLFDFYGDLLTEKQYRICDYYLNQDYSLQEIAELEGVSRSAIHDTIQRATKDLTYFEEKLKLYSSYEKRMKLYEKIKKVGNKEVNQLIEECIELENMEEDYD